MNKLIIFSIFFFSASYFYCQSSQGKIEKQLTPNQLDNKIKSIKHRENKRLVVPFFCEDFANGFDGNNDVGSWTVEDNGTGEGDGALIELGTSNTMSNGQFSSNVDPLASTSADNGYALFDVDGYNTQNNLYVDNVAPGITGYLYFPELDMTEHASALVTWEHFFRYCCFNFSPFTLEVSVDGGSNWTLFAAEGDFNPAANVFSENAAQVSVDISSVAANQPAVQIRFAYNSYLADIYDQYGASYFAYFWAIDDVCISEKPDNDVQINYSVISQIPETGIEYGRVPESQLNDVHHFDVNIYNFGITDQHNVTINATISNGTTDINLTQNVGTLIPGQTMDVELTYDQPLSVGIYSGTFTLTSDEETDGENFGNNIDTRTFEITDGQTGLYSLDGIGVYPEPLTSDFRLGSFNDGGEPATLGAFLNMYDLKANSVVAGLRVMLGSSSDIVGSQVYPILSDTADVLNNDVSSTLSAGDAVTISSADVSAGYVDLMFFEPYIISDDNIYFAGVFIEDGVDFTVLDDGTVPQPAFASAFFIENTTYSNGNAFGIRLLNGAAIGVDELVESDFTVEQNSPNPAVGLTTVKYNLKKGAKVIFEIIDVTGKVVLVRNEGKIREGVHTISFDVKDLSAGIYSYKLTVGNQSVTKKLIVE